MEDITLVTMNQLIDLSLGVTEPGLVHYHLLQHVLKILVLQLNMDDLCVEFRGDQGDIIKKLLNPSLLKSSKAKSAHTAKSPNKSETSSLSPDNARRSSNKSEISSLSPVSEEILNVKANKQLQSGVSTKRGRTHEESLSEKNKSDTMYSLSEIIKEASQTSRSIVLVNDDINHLQNPTFTVAATTDQMYAMMRDIEELKDKMMEIHKMPSTDDILLAARRKSSVFNKPVVEMFHLMSLMKRTEGLEESMEKLANIVDRIAGDQESEDESQGNFADELNIDNIDMAKIDTKKGMAIIQKELVKIKSLLYEADESSELDENQGDQVPLRAKLQYTNVKIDQCKDQINALHAYFTNKVNVIDKDVANLFENITRVKDKSNTDQEETEKGIQYASRADNQFKDINQDIVKIYQMSATLDQNIQKKTEMLDSIMEQLEMLKIEKIDREQLDQMLATKVDAEALVGKVSQDRFTTTCDDLSKNIENALTRLLEQQEWWEQALVDIEREIGSKLNKNEMDRLEDFVSSKISALQNRLKSLKTLKQEQESAAAKKPYISQLQCIVCDNDVTMKKKETTGNFPPPPSVSPTKTMGPYLAYELDQLRKQQKNLYNSKNMNHVEQVMKHKHSNMINRYCGGNHTLTTPQQRVTRVGHFLEQWGPEISLTADEMIKGKDGIMYKAAFGEGTQTLLSEKAKPSLMVQAANFPSSARLGVQDREVTDTFIETVEENKLKLGKTHKSEEEKKLEALEQEVVEEMINAKSATAVQSAPNAMKRGSKTPKINIKKSLSAMKKLNEGLKLQSSLGQSGTTFTFGQLAVSEEVLSL